MNEIKDITLLLDADSLVYSIQSYIDNTYIAEVELDMLCQEDIEEATRVILGNVIHGSGCSERKVFIGSPTNFRKDIATLAEYKSNRKDLKRPQHYHEIRAAMVAQGAIVVEEQEAEDAVGIAAYSCDSYDEYIVGAIDKDMRMIAGNHYNYRTRESDFVDEVQAMRNFMLQLATGDATDNIPGVYKQLLLADKENEAHKFKYSRYKKKLEEKLKEVDTELKMYKIVEDIYKQYDLLDNIVEVGRLLWIRRYEGELWLPPSFARVDYIAEGLNRS